MDTAQQSGLFVVATPIGNIRDISLRALDILGVVDHIACEDTRETQRLLKEHGISAQCSAYHAQSPQRVEDALLQRLRDGESIALLSDRGTPGISDPGQRLVVRAVEEGIPVHPVPGPTALITALQAAGADTSSFWFRGFIPHKKGRQTFLETSLAHDGTVVFYESPHRILKCLQSAVDLGADARRFVVARELTKMHEEFLRGTAADIFADLSSRDTVRGEFVVILDSR